MAHGDFHLSCVKSWCGPHQGHDGSNTGRGGSNADGKGNLMKEKRNCVVNIKRMSHENHCLALVLYSKCNLAIFLCPAQCIRHINESENGQKRTSLEKREHTETNFVLFDIST